MVRKIRTFLINTTVYSAKSVFLFDGCKITVLSTVLLSLKHFIFAKNP